MTKANDSRPTATERIRVLEERVEQLETSVHETRRDWLHEFAATWRRLAEWIEVEDARGVAAEKRVRELLADPRSKS